MTYMLLGPPIYHCRWRRFPVPMYTARRVFISGTETCREPDGERSLPGRCYWVGWAMGVIPVRILRYLSVISRSESLPVWVARAIRSYSYIVTSICHWTRGGSRSALKKSAPSLGLCMVPYLLGICLVYGGCLFA